jgi:hypothetical protein
MRSTRILPRAPPITRLLPQMLSSAALVALLLFSGSVIAQINGTGCTHSSVYVWVRRHDVSCQHTFDGPTDSLIQEYNSLNQNPCEVAAYLQSTCNGGCECSFCIYKSCHLMINDRLPQRLPLVLSCPESRTPAQAFWTVRTCACATLLHIPS